MIIPIVPSILTNSHNDEASVRAATDSDVARIVDLCVAHRRSHAGGFSGFYAVDSDYPAKKQHDVSQLIRDMNNIALVHETRGLIDGVLLGRLVDAPPVYAPGGKVCLVMDYFVSGDAQWPAAGRRLLDIAEHAVRKSGGVVLVVEAMDADAEKRNWLSTAGFSIATDWCCRDIDLLKPAQSIDGVIEPATQADLHAIVDLSERQQVRLQQYQPVFWRKATDSADRRSSFFSWLLGNGSDIVLVHRTGSTVDGFIVAKPSASLPYAGGHSCNVDDFTVADPAKWSVGAWLLYTAAVKAKSRGAGWCQVICPHEDKSKGRMLESMGFRTGHEWLVKSVGN